MCLAHPEDPRHCGCDGASIAFSKWWCFCVLSRISTAESWAGLIGIWHWTWKVVRTGRRTLSTVRFWLMPRSIHSTSRWTMSLVCIDAFACVCVVSVRVFACNCLFTRKKKTFLCAAMHLSCTEWHLQAACIAPWLLALLALLSNKSMMTSFSVKMTSCVWWLDFVPAYVLCAGSLQLICATGFSCHFFARWGVVLGAKPYGRGICHTNIGRGRDGARCAKQVSLAGQKDAMLWRPYCRWLHCTS